MGRFAAVVRLTITNFIICVLYQATQMIYRGDRSCHRVFSSNFVRFNILQRDNEVIDSSIFRYVSNYGLFPSKR